MITKVQLLKSLIDNNPTVRLLQRKLDGLHYDKLSCNDDYDDVFEEERSLQGEKRIGAKNRPYTLNTKKYFNHYCKLSSEEDLEPAFAVRKPVEEKIKTCEKPAQQVQRPKSAYQEDTDRKTASKCKQAPNLVQQLKQIQTQGQGGKANRPEEEGNLHRKLCQTPSWRDDEKARQKFGQRRTAVCDNIERQLVNDNGVSLRNLRKYMVVEYALQEVSLL